MEAEWDSLVNGDSKEARLLNRATQGLYPPGSTFKVITALEYMREHPGAYDGFHFSCDGIYEYENIRIQCYRKTAHGEEDFAASFANSCNGAFASLGLELDLDGLKGLSEQLLFNRDQPLSIPYKQSVYQMETDAEDWEIMQTAMGQGSTLMTPMHNLMVMAAIANDGILMKPYFVDHVENPGGQTVKKFKPEAYGELMVANEAAALKELLVRVVNEGTGSSLRTDAYQAAGKTGSAEFETGEGDPCMVCGLCACGGSEAGCLCHRGGRRLRRKNGGPHCKKAVRRISDPLRPASLKLLGKKGFLFSSGRDRIENNREAGKTGGGKDTYPGKRGVTI